MHRDTSSSTKSLLLGPAVSHAKNPTLQWVLCKCHLGREHHTTACSREGYELFATYLLTTRYAVRVCPRFRPPQLLWVSPVRTKFDLTCAELRCIKEPLQIAWYSFFVRSESNPIQPLCVCVCLFLFESFQQAFLATPARDDCKHSSHMTGAL